MATMKKDATYDTEYDHLVNTYVGLDLFLKHFADLQVRGPDAYIAKKSKSQLSPAKELYNFFDYVFGKYRPPKWFQSICVPDVIAETRQFLNEEGPQLEVNYMLAIAVAAMSGASPFKRINKSIIDGQMYISGFRAQSQRESVITGELFSKKELHWLLKCPFECTRDRSVKIFAVAKNEGIPDIILSKLTHTNMHELNLEYLRLFIRYFAHAEEEKRLKLQQKEEAARLLAEKVAEYAEHGIPYRPPVEKQPYKAKYKQFKLDLSVAEINDIMDYIRGKLREVVVDIEQQYRESVRHDFISRTLKQTLPTLLDEMDRWHRDLARAKELSREGDWDPSGIGNYWLEFPYHHSDKYYGIGSRDVSFTELLSGADLAKEGSTMHHCVKSYTYRCREGSCAIYSMTIDTTHPYIQSKKTLTLEIRLGKAPSIVQVRGFANRLPTPQEKEWIRSFARAKGLDTRY